MKEWLKVLRRMVCVHEWRVMQSVRTGYRLVRRCEKCGKLEGGTGRGWVGIN